MHSTLRHQAREYTVGCRTRTTDCGFWPRKSPRMGCQPCNYHHEGNQRYLAPEWISGAITSKVDVFSYGKLLFEIRSGKRNMEELNSDTRNYLPLQVANPIAKGEDVLPLVDRRLNGLVEMEEVCRACNVACWCIQDSERDRQTMSQVVQIMVVEKPSIPRIFLQIVGSYESDA